jgi:hypothetical protein
MRSSIIIVIINLLHVCNYVSGQGREIRTNRYLYKDSVLFEDSWEQFRNQLNVDLYLIDTVSFQNTSILKTEKDSLLIYLSERMRLYFISLHPNSRGDKLLSVNTIEPLGDCCPFFPSEILHHNLISHGLFHVIIVFVEAEGPMFLINIYEWDSAASVVSAVYESGYYFSYPSWNPTIEKETIKVKDKKVYIPYCDGCESGTDGVLKWDVLVYDDDYMLVK